MAITSIVLYVYLVTVGLFAVYVIRHTGVLTKIYLELFTNPFTSKIIIIIGDVLYMVGGSVIAASIYALLETGETSFIAFFAGVFFTSIGSILKKNMKN